MFAQDYVRIFSKIRYEMEDMYMYYFSEKKMCPNNPENKVLNQFLKTKYLNHFLKTKSIKFIYDNKTL